MPEQVGTGTVQDNLRTGPDSIPKEQECTNSEKRSKSVRKNQRSRVFLLFAAVLAVSVIAMAILSVDLAYRRWSDLGLVVLDRALPAPTGLFAPPPLEAIDPTVHCEMLDWDAEGNLDSSVRGLGKTPVNPEILAGRLNHFCNTRNIRVIVLDGPQAWKSSHNGLEHARVSERQLNTPAKTGLPGLVKPISYRPFAEFCLDVYDALSRRGWRRLDTHQQPGSLPDRILVESYPHAAWKSLGLSPLPSKRRARISDLAEAFAALHALIPLSTTHPPNHDQLQAIVGGLPGLALDERDTAGAHFVGHPPRREEGHWREGFIVLPVAPLDARKNGWLS
jgi:hypothetical protein